jgi:indole-3-glycerol phosphate synthase
MLQRILDHKRHEVAAQKRRLPQSASPAAPETPTKDFAAALRAPGLSVIAEFKRKSPSRGWIAADRSVAEQVRSYARGGAVALSVLTDEHFFGGSPADPARAKQASGLAVLRKDFIVDPCQVRESKAMAADAVLLIAAALDQATLLECMHAAAEVGLTTVVEVHDESDLERAVAAGAGIVGINRRDLRTFHVDLERGLRLRRLVPAGRLTIAESGVRNRADAEAVYEAGFDAVLVGEALMQAADPAALVRELAVGRASPRVGRSYGHSP